MKKNFADILMRATMRRSFCAALTCAAWLSLQVGAKSAPVEMKDASGRIVVVKDASRIVSIGGAITEILYALGRSDRIVAVDTTSIYPPQVMGDKPNVGYMRQLSPEGVLSTRPTLLLAIDGAGPKEAIAVLEAAGAPLVTVPDRFDANGIIEKIRIVADVAGARTAGECLAASIKSDFAALDELRGKIEKPAKVIFVLSMAGDRLMVAGHGTAADSIIRLAGGINAITSFEGYKAINDEAVINAAPDAVLMMQRGQHAASADEVFEKPAFKMTPAAGRKALMSLDGLYLLGFGPRTAAAARDVAAGLYPRLATSKLPSEAHPAECRE